MQDQLLFVVMPAAAVLVALSAGLVRYIRWHRQPAATRLRLTADESTGAAGIWRWAIAIVLLGHLLAFAFPASVLLWNRQPVRLLLLEGTGLLGGGLALAGFLAMLVKRVLANGGPGAHSVVQVVAGTLIAIEMISGLAIAILYRWASSWSGVTLVPYLLSLLHMQPAVALVASLPFLVRLHVVCAFALLAVAPFTGTVRFVFVPLDRVTAWIFAPVAALGRPAWSSLESWTAGRVRLLHAVFVHNEREEN